MFFSTMRSGRARRALAAAAALAAAGLLVSCGGGTSQFEAFEPDQFLVFGDEASLLTADGRKYSVNVLDSNGAIACRTEPIWVQAMLANFGHDLTGCHPDTTLDVKGVMLAANGAKVDDFKAQVDALVAAGLPSGKLLATVLVGTHDVLELYRSFPTQSEDTLTTELRARGDRLAEQINRLIDLGVRVIVSTIPDLGVTPFAAAEKAAFTDTDRAALLTRLTAALNSRMRVQVLNDGRFLGMVLADEMTQSMAKVPSAFGLNNATVGVCTKDLPDCSSATVVESGTSASYLWADSIHMAYGGHQRLGLLAISRARNNPF